MLYPLTGISAEVKLTPVPSVLPVVSFHRSPVAPSCDEIPSLTVNEPEMVALTSNVTD